VSLIITLKGIDEALSNLNYRNKNSLKYRIVHSIRDFYADEASVESMREIETDELIKLSWDTGDDPTIIRNRRRNFSSIKSSINGDLKRLYRDGKNPEGLTIGPTDIFVISDEAKEEILKNFTYGAKGETAFTMSQITEVLKVVNDILSKPEQIADEGGADALGKLDQLRDIIQGLSEKIYPDEADGEEDLEDVEVVEEPEEVEEAIEDAEEIEDLEEVETEDDFEEVEELDGVEEADISIEGLGDAYPDGGYEDEEEKARLLAEEFNDSLAAMDKFYNQYILIPEGEYIVGGKHPKKNEKAERKVHLSPFYIGKFPITNSLFEIFIEKTGYRTTAEKIGYGTVYHGRYRRKVDEKTGLETLTWSSALVNKTVQGACWYQPLGPGSTLHNKKNHPVVQVSLEDAMAFSAWSGKRLPTEDEWEAASKTARGYEFPWGNEWREGSCNIEESYIGDTTPVDKYIEFANDFGIVDIIGNVLEWTLDSSTPPSKGKNGFRYHIVKGGNWTSGNDIRLLSRFKFEPESHANMLGFRGVAY